MEQRYRNLTLASISDQSQGHLVGDLLGDEWGGDEREGEDQGGDEKIDGSTTLHNNNKSWSQPWFIPWADIITWGLIFVSILLVYGWSLWLHQYKDSDALASLSPTHKSKFGVMGRVKHTHAWHNPTSTTDPTSSPTSTLTTAHTMAYIVSGVLMDGMGWLGLRLLRYTHILLFS